MFIENIPILDVPSRYGFSTSEPVLTLEEMIKQKFGESGLKKFKDSDITLDIPSPRFEDSVLCFYKEGALLDADQHGAAIGEVYTVSLQRIDQRIERVTAKNVACQAFAADKNNSNRTSNLILTLDLNPIDKKCQYLRLSFQY